MRLAAVLGLCGMLARLPGATVYDKAGHTTQRSLARDEDVVVQSESAAWDVAITCLGLMWSRAPQPWPTCELAAPMAGYLRAVADWVVVPPPARGRT